MAEFTNRAFNYAMLERGPVQLNIPRDHFYGDVVTKIPAPANTERSAGGPAALKVKYFKNSLFYFGRSFVSENFTYFFPALLYSKSRTYLTVKLKKNQRIRDCFQSKRDTELFLDASFPRK